MSSIKINELPSGSPNNNSLFVIDNTDIGVTQKISLRDMISFSHFSPNMTNINNTGSITFLNESNSPGYIRMNSPGGSVAITAGTFPVYQPAGYGPLLLLKGTFKTNPNDQEIEFYTVNQNDKSILQAGMLVFPSTAPNRVGVLGSVIANSFVSVSDATFKENITPLSGCLDLVNQLNPVQFNFISGSPLNHHNDTTVGFLAQEVEEVFKDTEYKKGITKSTSIKTENLETNFLSLNELNLVSILTQAIKELTVKVNILESLLHNS